MQKHLEIAKRITNDPESNGLNYLKEVNLHNTFKGIYGLNVTLKTANLLSAYIIYAYNPESGWLDIRKDRQDNKMKIVEALGIDPSLELMDEVLVNANEDINDIIVEYLSEIADWRWTMIYSLFDYHSTTLRFVNKKTEEGKSFDEVDKDGKKITLTEEYDIDKISKVQQQKGQLLEQAIKSREQGEKLLLEIRKDYVATDNAVQQDFGFAFTDTAKKKVDIMSWRAFIKNRNNKISI